GYATSSRVARIRPKAASGVGASGARLPGRRRSPERVSRVRFAYPGYATARPGGDSAARGDAPGLASALARRGRGALRLPGLRSPAATLLRVATRRAAPAPWRGRGAVRFACPGYAVG